MSAPKLTAAQVRALGHLSGRIRNTMGWEEWRAACESLVPLGLASERDLPRRHDADGAEAWAITDAGRAALAAHESEGVK